MSLSRIGISVSMILLSCALSNNVPSFARCACLDTPEDAARRARQESELQKLPSEKARGIAREFWQRGMRSDAAQYYKEATDKAEEEASKPASIPYVDAHAAVVEREAAEFFKQNSNTDAAAHALELALSHTQNDGANSSALMDIAQLFEQAGDKQKAAEYYAKLVSVLASTKGRYNPETLAAQRNYQRLAGLTASR